MKKTKLLLAAAALMLGGSVWAQTDVTSTYITNPGFEGNYTRFYDINDDRGCEKPIGWSVEWSQDNTDTNGMTYVGSMTQDGQTWSAHGGDKAYLSRMRWANATLNLRQTMSNLRPGSYTLSFYATASKLNEGNGSASVSVAGQSQSITVGTSETTNWTQYTIDFSVTSSTPYATIEVTASRTAGNFKFGIDDFTLTYDGSSYYSTILTAAQTLYDDNEDWAENGLSDFATAITTNSGKETIADKNAAIVALEEAMMTFKEANTVDVTSKIINATFDSNISSWTTTGGDGNAYQWNNSSQTNFNGGFLEKWRNGWNGGYNQKNFDVYQTLSSLPNGEYTVKAAIIAVMQGSKESKQGTYQNKKHGGPYYIDDDHGVWLYGTSGGTTAKAWANTKNSAFDGDGAEYKTATITVSNGSLTIGFKGVGSESGGTSLGTYANWIACDNWTLSYFGFDPTTLLAEITSLKSEALSLLSDDDYTNVVGTERTDLTTASTLVPADEKKATLESAISQIEGAISAFTAAKANYDALVVEIAKAKALGIADATADGYAATTSSTAATALTNTQNLKVAEYEYVEDNYAYGVDLGTWTTTNAVERTGQHWDGTGSSSYSEQNEGWGSSSWTCSYTQDITLPAGSYVFKVAGRTSSGNCTLSLVVTNKNTSDEIGSINDFPKGDVGLGINTSGETDFTTGEGHTYANSGAGRGWEWRYVQFTLASDATVTIAVNGSASEMYQWLGFCNYTVQTDNEANISLIAYNIALNDAITARDNDDYTNVTGDEKTALQDAIDADESLDKTDKDDIDAATTALNEATSAFTDAKGAYDAFVAAKAVEYEDNLPYASSTKFAAIGTAQAATATSASDATSKTAAIISAYRKYVESNAMAEGVTGAENKTSLISDPNMDVTYDGTAHTFGAWQVFSQTDGTISLKTESDEPLTDSDGNKYKYADIWKSDNNGGIKQTLSNLPAGKYLLTVAARAQNAAGATFGLFAGGARTEIPQINNTGGVFGNGWNDVSLEFFVTTTTDVEIGVQSGNGKTMWWGATRFRLVRLGDATESVTVTEADYATYASDYPLDFTDSSIKAYIAEANGTTGVTFTQINKVPAGTGVLLYKDGGETESIPFFAGDADATTGNVFVRGTGATVASVVETTKHNYILNNGASGIGFYRAAGQTVATNRAYIQIDEATPVKEFISLPGSEDDADGISLTPALSDGEGEIYNLAGQRMNKMQKGINIVNGKKVLF